MKILLSSLIDNALKQIGINATDKVQIDYARDKNHGDFASNIAMLLAKTTGRNPRTLATEIISHIPSHPAIAKIQVAGNGFINFLVCPVAFQPLLDQILEKKTHFGKSSIGKKRKIHIEFVSSNPTGPLHVGHGRGAAYGASLANLLEAIGCTVHREYYVNDAGRQMDILTVSIWLRYLQKLGEQFDFPSNGYQGDYVYAIADMIYQNKAAAYQHASARIFENITPDTEDKEAHIDGIIAHAKTVLGENAYRDILTTGLDSILTDIREDLKEFGVIFDNWFSERSLIDEGLIPRAIKKLQDAGHLYQKDGALWFRTTTFGDDKDRVIKRDNGLYTYFASDIAYHLAKFEAGYTEVIDVLGADHHGYIPRLKAIIEAFHYSVSHFHAPIVQFATLYRGKERVSMSTRSGSFVTLRELRNETGNDAARFFYIMRKADQHMDFDMALARSQSNDNPVYYVQYAHARIASVFRQLREKNQHFEPDAGIQAIDLLDTAQEKTLLLLLSRYTDVISQAALQFEPHTLAHYLRELADGFHSYYNACPFLVTEDTLRHARLCLVMATRQVLANGLELLGVSAPEMM